jgi:hypothetical protein
VDAWGDAYVTGDTLSRDFPLADPFQSAFGGGRTDVFVTALTPDGSALIYSTYLGGSGEETGYGLAVDFWGDAFVGGRTESPDFPTVNPLQPAYGGGSFDAFVAMIGSPWLAAPRSLSPDTRPLRDP